MARCEAASSHSQRVFFRPIPVRRVPQPETIASHQGYTAPIPPFFSTFAGTCFAPDAAA
jgi:hypothetical protein